MTGPLLSGLKDRNPVWLGSLAALAAAQGCFAWDFWGALDDDVAGQLRMRLIGGAFIGAELVALDMASRAAIAREGGRAAVLCGLWLAVAAMNLGVDVNALGLAMSDGDAARKEAVAAYARRRDEIAELEGLIVAAAAAYDHPLKPVEAYDAEIAGLEGEAARAASWRAAQINRELIPLEGERAAAAKIEAWRGRLEATRQADDAPAAAPPAAAEEFKTLADALTVILRTVQGVMAPKEPAGAVSPEAARGGVVVLGAVVMKLLLSLGVWAGLSRRRERPRPAKAWRDAEPRRPDEGSAVVPSLEATPVEPEALAPPRRPKLLSPPRRASGDVQRFGPGGRR